MLHPKLIGRSGVFFLSSICVAFLLSPVMAEEGGTGHYLPGSISSFVDGTATKPTLVARVNGIYYQGSIGAEPIPFAGVGAINVSAESYAAGLTLLWRPTLDLPDKWSYAMSTTLPYVWLDVKGTVTAGAQAGRKSDSVEGLGDIVLMPLMLSYEVQPDLHIDGRLGIYVPTGDYEVGRLANTGKNFWTLEPTIGLLYFGQKNGLEASAYVGADFNSENNDTNYQSGTQLHVDGTLAQHFPLAGGFAGVGASAYWYQQVTGDSGEGANFGDFKGHTFGLGPAISFVRKIGNTDIIAEAKWLHEFETDRRLEGDYIWLKVVFKF